MANRRADKLCVEIRVCVDNDTDKEVLRHQAYRFLHDGCKLSKPEAASELFMKLISVGKSSEVAKKTK